MYERVLYHDMHGCNHEKGFDVFLQGAGKVPLLNAASETDGSAVASRNTPKSQNTLTLPAAVVVLAVGRKHQKTNCYISVFLTCRSSDILNLS